MKKTVYMAPAIEITKIQIQSLMKAISGVGGDTGIEPGGEDPIPEGSDGDARRRTVWDDEEDENY